MSNSPQQLIADQQAKVIHLRVALAEAEATLKGMEAIFSVTSVARKRRVSTGGVSSSQETSMGGRQPGAISKRWRPILHVLHKREGGFTLQDTVDLVLRIQHRAIKPSEARRVLDSYKDHGYISEAASGRLFVTQEAAERFDFNGIAEVPGLAHSSQPSLADDHTNPNAALGTKANTWLGFVDKSNALSILDAATPINQLYRPLPPVPHAAWPSGVGTPPVPWRGGKDEENH